MPYIECTLPPYPVSEDMWDKLAKESRPVLVYGMGNGADKLFNRLARYGITPADIFASDGFVRGHSFRGMRVKSFSEIREEYSDFVILLSFASSRREVLDMLASYDSEYDMYIPDMPVAGEEEYFDKDFYNSHYTEILRAYNRLADEDSRRAFASVVNYKLSGRMRYLAGAFSTKEELYSMLRPDSVRSYIDVGAYNGDTLREAVEYFPNLCRAVAIEPDPKTFRRLKKYTDTVDNIDIKAYNAAAWCTDGEGGFTASGNRNSSVDSTASYEHREQTVSLCRVDSLGTEADYIKYDVEGAEHEALLGSSETIGRCRPTLLVSAYHRSRDIFSLTNDLGDKYPFYKIYLRRLECVPAWELDLIFTED